MDLIYLDSSATTPMLPEVWEAMRPFYAERSGNPSSSHGAGRLARQALEDAREQVAVLVDAHPDEVLFTSGATEANNLALFGLPRRAGASSPGHIISSPIEHPCVSEPIRQLMESGFSHDTLAVDNEGIVRAELSGLIREETQLVAVMLANHETGAIQPVAELRQIVNGRAAFHCDAAAAAGKMAISFKQLGVTTLTISAHKFHGPKGVGALLVRKHAKLRPLLFGGHQQQGRRPGTEPVALAVGLASALAVGMRDLESRRAKVAHLRRRFLDALRAGAAPVIVNGPEDDGIPHTLNLSFPACRADVLLMTLDLAGIACSTGSACSSGSLLPSPVLQAMHVPDDVLHSAMRFSFSALLTEAEVDEAARRIVRAVGRLRMERIA